MLEDKDVWNILDLEYKRYPQDFGKSNDEEKIKQAEESLALTFTSSYKKFLNKYGSATLPGHIIYGLTPLPEMGTTINNVIDKTNFYKQTQKWPGIDNWYIISDDGRGNPIGIDPEGKVWLSDHDADFEQVNLAENFEKFLYKLLTDTLYELN